MQFLGREHYMIFFNGFLSDAQDNVKFTDAVSRKSGQQQASSPSRVPWRTPNTASVGSQLQTLRLNSGNLDKNEIDPGNKTHGFLTET
jgi:hypothetical protein